MVIEDIIREGKSSDRCTIRFRVFRDNGRKYEVDGSYKSKYGVFVFFGDDFIIVCTDGIDICALIDKQGQIKIVEILEIE